MGNFRYKMDIIWVVTYQYINLAVLAGIIGFINAEEFNMVGKIGGHKAARKI